jgi:hypothetical protein
MTSAIILTPAGDTARLHQQERQHQLLRRPQPQQQRLRRLPQQQRRQLLLQLQLRRQHRPRRSLLRRRRRHLLRDPDRQRGLARRRRRARRRQGGSARRVGTMGGRTAGGTSISRRQGRIRSQRVEDNAFHLSCVAARETRATLPAALARGGTRTRTWPRSCAFPHRDGSLGRSGRW